ncbi:hypothetical protein D3C72_808750 [compost metagenome]
MCQAHGRAKARPDWLLAEQHGAARAVGEGAGEQLGFTRLRLFGYQCITQQLAVGIGQVCSIQTSQGAIEAGAGLQVAGFFSHAQGHAPALQAFALGAAGMRDQLLQGIVWQTGELAAQGLRFVAKRCAMAFQHAREDFATTRCQVVGQ